MTYSTTITRKGQLTIPQPMRQRLKLDPGKRIDLEFDKKKKTRIIMEVHPDILELAGTFKPKKKINVLKARKAMEKNYERV